MNNISNDLFDFVWDPISEKLLICKDDPELDCALIKSLTTSKDVTEILHSSTVPKTIDSTIYDNIHIAYLLINAGKPHKAYRIFKVDRVSKFIGLNPSILYLLEFTQNAFEDLILCNTLIKQLNYTRNRLLRNVGSNHLNYNQVKKFIKDHVTPLEVTIVKKVKKHMTNKRKRYNC